MICCWFEAGTSGWIDTTRSLYPLFSKVWPWTWYKAKKVTNRGKICLILIAYLKLKIFQICAPTSFAQMMLQKEVYLIILKLITNWQKIVFFSYLFGLQFSKNYRFICKQSCSMQNKCYSSVDLGEPHTWAGIHQASILTCSN